MPHLFESHDVELPDGNRIEVVANPDAERIELAVIESATGQTALVSLSLGELTTLLIALGAACVELGTLQLDTSALPTWPASPVDPVHIH